MRKAAVVDLLCERTTEQQRQGLWVPAFAGTTWGRKFAGTTWGRGMWVRPDDMGSDGMTQLAPVSRVTI